MSRKKGGTYYDSIKAAAAVLGIDIAFLRWCKEQGCTAFRAGGRVYEEDLLPWIEKNKHRWSGDEPKTRKIKLQCEILAVELEKRRIEKDNLKGVLMARSEHDSDMLALAEHVKSCWRKFKTELIPKLHGLSIPEMIAKADEMEPDYFKMCRELRTN